MIYAIGADASLCSESEWRALKCGAQRQSYVLHIVSVMSTFVLPLRSALRKLIHTLFMEAG